MDEAFAELFARHPSSGFFEGNPIDAFGTFIAGEEYGVDKTPDLLGLYGGRYPIVFRPGELWRAVCADNVEANPCFCLYPGVNYMYHKICDDMLMVEQLSRESEMSDEEYKCNLRREDQLRPATGGCLFKAQMVGTGYMQQDVE